MKKRPKLPRPARTGAAFILGEVRKRRKRSYQQVSLPRGVKILIPPTCRPLPSTPLGRQYLVPQPRADSQVTRSGLPTLGAASGLSRRDLSWVTFNRLLRQWGTPALAERAAHDLFFNVRSLAPSLSRLRLFGAFTGCFPPERAGSSFEVGQGYMARRF